MALVEGKRPSPVNRADAAWRAPSYQVLLALLVQPGLLAAVQMPFVNPKVGAVGTRQNVHEPRSSVWRRVADWIIDLRYMDYVPATARRGGVVCVSGRTAAYRRSAVLPDTTRPMAPRLVDPATTASALMIGVRPKCPRSA